MPIHSRTHSHGQDSNPSASAPAPTNHPPASSQVQTAHTLSSNALPSLRLQTSSQTQSSTLSPSTDHQATSILNPSSSTVSLHQRQQQQILGQQTLHSPPDLYSPQRPTDPVQLQQLASQGASQYSAYQQQHQLTPTVSNSSQSYLPYSGGPSGTSGRQDASSSGRTMSTHRTGGSGSVSYSSAGAQDTNTSSTSKYTPSSMQSSSGAGSGERKYNHPNSLPSYTSSTVNHVDPYAGTIGSANGRYLAPWAIFAVDWCKWPVVPGGNGLGGFGRVAIGSYSEDSHNCIQILSTAPMQQSRHSGHPSDTHNQPSIEFTKLAEASHTYPITRILWEPPTASKPFTDLLATSGDHLRLWSLPNTNSASSPNPPPSNPITRTNSLHPQSQKLTPLALLSNSKSNDSTAPLTSLDWNTISPALIITSSIDTTCTVWDIPTLTAKTQLIAHDKEVYDVRFMSNSVDVFASCGADGSVRMFDLRSLEHSTIIYEPTVGKPGWNPTGQSPTGLVSPPPLLRLAASPHDQHLIATFAQDSNLVRILDVRQPGQALIELRGHSNNVNCVEWAPNRRGYIAAGGDDCLVLIWDLLNSSTSVPLNPGGGSGSGSSSQGQIVGQQESHARTPVMVWRSDWEVNNISWSPPTTTSAGTTGHSEWLGVVGGRGIWGVKL
ncbi:WD40-repeat-containing domain protein [Kalaharituber pfeilii]|nr:WD40-repeat-containing domain protein [Kalaharituber pfeilii]